MAGRCYLGHSLDAHLRGIEPCHAGTLTPAATAQAQRVLVHQPACSGEICCARAEQLRENERFVEAYRKKYNRIPDNAAALEYTSAKIVGAVLKDVGPAPSLEKVREALSKITDLPVILGRGKFNFDADRGALNNGVILTVKNDKFVQAP